MTLIQAYTWRSRGTSTALIVHSMSEVLWDSMSVFWAQPVRLCLIHPGHFFPLKADLAAGRSERRECSWAERSITAPHSRKRANTALLFWTFHDVLRHVLLFFNTKKYTHFDVDPYGCRVSLRGWESLPGEGRPPQLFPAPRTVKTWSLQHLW